MQSTLRSWRYEIALLAAALFALGFHFSFPAPSGDAPALLLFLGRMHPLVVHLPIGVLLLVAVLEVVSLHPKRQDQFRGALDFILPVAVLTALAAFVLGVLLAQEGGFPLERLNLHRRLALATVVLSCLQVAVWSSYRRTPSNSRMWIYRGVMVATLAVLSLASHEGGTLSRGEAYLAKYAPEFLKPLLGAKPQEAASEPPAPPEPSAEPTVFAHAVQPLLDQYCVECHGEEKAKGKLRLDSFEAVMAGGEAGTAIVPGDGVNSLLVSRMMLPTSDDDVMPPDGEPAPTEAEIELIQFWIERGATEDLRLKDLLPPTDTRKALERALARAHRPVPTSTKDSAPDETAPTEAKDETADITQPPLQDNDTTPEDPAGELDEPRPSSAPAIGNGFELLQARCGSCHGAQKQKGKLRVDSLGALERGGASGPAVVWGVPGQSKVVQSIRLPLDHSDHMPPKKKHQVSGAELAAIESWIRAQKKRAAPTVSEPRAKTVQPSPISPSTAASPTNEDGVSTVHSGDAPPDPDLCATPTSSLREGYAWLFDDVVQPILIEKCSTCHSDELASGALKLHDCDGVHRGGNEGSSVVAGSPLESRLMRRIHLPLDDDEHMPPEDYPQVDDDERVILEKWISEGADRSTMIAQGGLPESLQGRLGVSGSTSSSEKEGRDATSSSAPPAVPPQSGGFAACQLRSHAPIDPMSWWLFLSLCGLGFARRSFRKT